MKKQDQTFDVSTLPEDARAFVTNLLEELQKATDKVTELDTKLTDLQKSLDSLRPLGMCAAYGHASGPPDPVDIIQDLGARGSLFITRPAVMHYLATRAALEEAAAGLFEVLKAGIVRSAVNHSWPLSQAAEAHRAIHERRTTGSTVLLPFD